MEAKDYINWDKIPKSITAVRFELIEELKKGLLCHGIYVIRRPKSDKLQAIMEAKDE